MKLKLVSNEYMRMLNWHFEQMGRAPIRKKTFMAVMAILNRRQRRLIIRQFEEEAAR